jgi:hypothetical protein
MKVVEKNIWRHQGWVIKQEVDLYHVYSVLGEIEKLERTGLDVEELVVWADNNLI